MFEALAFTAGLALAATATPAAEAAASDRALLEATDPFARAASSSRARLRVTGSGGRATALEIWRSGENALVRFLDPKESGKYLLRARDGTFFISPGARQPVRLPPTHRLAGAVAIEELLAVPLSATHEIAAVQRRDTASGVVEFDLKARNAAAPIPECAGWSPNASACHCAPTFSLPTAAWRGCSSGRSGATRANSPR